MAADRYQHLETEIRPALASSTVVVCDRYVAWSLILQRLDGVPTSFIWALAEYADRPDLTALLISDTARARERAAQLGLYSRFHRRGLEAATVEVDAYRAAAAELHDIGWSVDIHDIGTQTADEVAVLLAGSALARPDGTRTGEPS